MSDFDQDEFRKDWIAALRSGKYEQTRGYLHYKGRFCCLGVACELLADRDMLERDEGGYKDPIDGHPDYVELEVLPDDVVQLIGMRNDCGSAAEDTKKKPDTLAGWNDNGETFLEIADRLETGDYWNDDDPE